MFSLLALRFVDAYNSQPAGTIIGLTACSVLLGTTRRYLRNLLDTLASVNIVTRCAKSEYIWHAGSRMHAALVTLRQATITTSAFRQVDLFAPQSASGAHRIVPLEYSRPYAVFAPPVSDSAANRGAASTPKGVKRKRSGHRQSRSSRESVNSIRISQAILQMFFSTESRVITIDEIEQWITGGPMIRRSGETESKVYENFKGKRLSERVRRDNVRRSDSIFATQP